MKVALVAAGHDAHVIATTPGGAGDGGVRVHRLALPRLPYLAAPPWAALPALRAIVERERFDVIHAQSAFSPLALCGAYLARRLGVCGVLTEHSVLRGAGGGALRILHRAIGWGDWPDVVAGVSGYVRGELERATGRTDVEVLWNGIDPRAWSRPGFVRDDGRVRIVTTMRLTRRKRPVELVRMIPEIVRRVPRGTPLRFCILGGGPELPRVRREAARLGVLHLVELPGWQAPEAVRAWLARSAVFVLPTSKEALSIATLEALSAGLPVVAYDHGGVGDVVVDGREGFLAPDRATFVERVVALAADAPLRRRMGEAGRAHVERFAWPKIVARHLDCYARAIDARGVLTAAPPLDKKLPASREDGGIGRRTSLRC